MLMECGKEGGLRMGFGDTVEGKVISRDCSADKSPPFPRKGERSTFTTRNFMSPL